MATQRVTLAKVGGIAADVILRRMREWSAARDTTNPNLWSHEQWPRKVCERVDAFANRLRASALTPPVIYFVEWADLWSAGNEFGRRLTLSDGSTPLVVLGLRFEVFAYSLPDGGRLAERLTTAAPQQDAESGWYITRLCEAVAAWDKLVERSVLVVLRQAVDVSVSDEEVTASLRTVPDWLADAGKPQEE